MPPYFVSFNPEIKLEENVSLFSPLHDPSLHRLLKAATGVLLPGYVAPWRYRCITRMAQNWFPRLESQFACGGKSTQIHLFRRLQVRHPETLLFKNPTHLLGHFNHWDSPWGYPLVLKGDTGGGGNRVHPIYAATQLRHYAARLPAHQPVLLQRWVDHQGRDLRVVVYGDRLVSYFRIGNGPFYNNVCRGGRIDHALLPEQQAAGIQAVRDLCRQAQIDIAGFDLMFPDQGTPVFIEINYHFGRKGLGGTPGHRQYVRRAVQEWQAKRLRLAAA